MLGSTECFWTTFQRMSLSNLLNPYEIQRQLWNCNTLPVREISYDKKVWLYNFSKNNCLPTGMHSMNSTFSFGVEFAKGAQMSEHFKNMQFLKERKKYTGASLLNYYRFPLNCRWTLFAYKRSSCSCDRNHGSLQADLKSRSKTSSFLLELFRHGLEINNHQNQEETWQRRTLYTVGVF